MKKILSLIVLLAFLCVSMFAYADDYDLAYKKISELPTLTTEASGDYIPVYDTSAGTWKKVDAGTRSGDLYFRSSLVAVGRATGTTKSLASSTTVISAADLAYTVILKSVGGNSSLDETDGGTRLRNGVSGQIVTFLITGLMTDGSWIITPATCTGFQYITLDTKGDVVQLLYVNDTVGWIIYSNGGAVITQA